ncbi:D-alanyl-D-alanine carboxypeptidase [Glaciihabitans sp. UYNi722]|uniref:D-alanyl-D-alanine carboxypeptidase/D-alanyl-D-alanine-endopeptidase n=1 Tax=Glaciihabitans sp. UYNi722 TaxID=3156344 RepID=UPI003398961E
MTDPRDPEATEPQNPTPTGPTDQPQTRREAREAAQVQDAEATQLLPGITPMAGPTGSASDATPAAEPTELLPGIAAVGPEAQAPPAGATELISRPVPVATSPADRKGVFAAISQHPKAWLIAAAAVVFVLLGTGSVFAGVAAGSSASASPNKVVGPSPTPKSTTPPPRPVPAALADPTHLRTCSIAAKATDPNLLTFQGSVINATTGEVLFDRNGATPSRTASVLKTLTSAAALAVLGPDYQLSTKVVAGAEPGSIVLVGGGDPTLSAGGGSVYKGAPTMTDLAAKVKSSLVGAEVTKVILDSSYWDPADNWDPSWERSEQTQGYQPEVTALMVDGSRANARAQDSPRSNDPIGDAGKAFISAMGLGDVKVETGVAPAGATPLGEVKSQPVKTLIGQMLPVSDNTLGEMLARVTSKVAGDNGSSASLAKVIPNALVSYGLKPTGVVIRDGSGLSNNNAVPATFVAQLMAKVAGGGQNLNIILDALPVAGKTGTLASRFTGANAVARGAISAKTGWIKTEYALAGVIHASDGTLLSFAFYALGAINSRTQPALDTITAGAFSCGNNLSNN